MVKFIISILFIQDSNLKLFIFIIMRVTISNNSNLKEFLKYFFSDKLSLQTNEALGYALTITKTININSLG